MMLLAALTAALAIVTQDQTTLRAAPARNAQQQAQLSPGDALEVRGQRLDYLQVYDHRRERAGYVLASRVRTVSTEPEAAPELLGVMRFLRETSGSEALGIAYAAAYLKAAPALSIDAEPFDAIATMADRMASRASSQSSSDLKLSAQLEVASGYGIGWISFEREGKIQTCYNGEAAQRVLTMSSATAEQRARAALILTRHECLDPVKGPLQKHQLNQQRAQVLDAVDTTDLAEPLKNRIRMRRAGVWATLAFENSRSGEQVADAADRALQELAAVNKSELTDSDQETYIESAVRVGASRWGAETVSAPKPGLSVATVPGETGETCVLLTDARHPVKSPLLKRCTYGTVWDASASLSPNGNALVLAVQPLESWTELWVFQKNGDRWGVQILPPAADKPDIGYVEFAGWIPGESRKMLAAREVRSEGRWKRSFEVVSLNSLETQVFADSPRRVGLFYRWQSPSWKEQTVSLR